jgi:hypothetical protein
VENLLPLVISKLFTNVVANVGIPWYTDSRRKQMKIVYQVEIQGQGFAPYEFATKKEAEDYVIGIVSWSGRKWRIVSKRVKASA